MRYLSSRIVGVLALGLILGSALSAGGLARAQEPSPTPSVTGTPAPPPTTMPAVTPPPVPPICERTPSIVQPGGSVVSMFGLTLTLPSGVGDFGVYFIPTNPGPNNIFICYIAGQSAIVITANGQETRREVTDPAANAVLDQVLASARVAATATATPVPSTSANRITAPDTGNAGLR